jgi:hypothetical protein
MSRQEDNIKINHKKYVPRKLTAFNLHGMVPSVKILINIRFPCRTENFLKMGG